MGGATLYVVATPIGHLGDLTARAAETLRAVPVVAAEDTRRSRTLLSHLDAHPRLISYHAHSPAQATQAILESLRDGRDVALVTDAGTPGISDPGAALVALVRNAGFPVVPIPGPSAVTTALSAAGLAADRWCFLGFLPRKGPERAQLLQRIGREEWTTVLFEAPGRVEGLLADLVAVCGGERRAVVARELTKIHEEFLSGTLSELGAILSGMEADLKGECSVLIEGTPAPVAVDATAKAIPVAKQLLAAGVSRRDAASLLTDLLGVSRNEAYRLVTEVDES